MSTFAPNACIARRFLVTVRGGTQLCRLPQRVFLCSSYVL